MGARARSERAAKRASHRTRSIDSRCSRLAFARRTAQLREAPLNARARARNPTGGARPSGAGNRSSGPNESVACARNIRAAPQLPDIIIIITITITIIIISLAAIEHRQCERAQARRVPLMSRLATTRQEHRVGPRLVRVLAKAQVGANAKARSCNIAARR